MKKIVITVALVILIGHLIAQNSTNPIKNEAEITKLKNNHVSQSIIIGLYAHNNGVGGCDPRGGLCIGRGFLTESLAENQAFAKISISKSDKENIVINISIPNIKLSATALKEILVKKEFIIEKESIISKEMVDSIYKSAKINLPSREIIIPSGTYGVRDFTRQNLVKSSGIFITMGFVDPKGKKYSKVIQLLKSL